MELNKSMEQAEVASTVPTEKKNESRYKHFCQRVSELSGIANGFSLVHVSGERPAVHEHRHDKSISVADLVELDAVQVKGKTICIFDDVISTGQSYGMFADRLERLGANVAGGIFLGRTHYKYKKEN